jgi:hypothetical protein
MDDTILVLKRLIKKANKLDEVGKHNEADKVDEQIISLAQFAPSGARGRIGTMPSPSGTTAPTMTQAPVAQMPGTTPTAKPSQGVRPGKIDSIDPVYYLTKTVEYYTNMYNDKMTELATATGLTVQALDAPVKSSTFTVAGYTFPPTLGKMEVGSTVALSATDRRQIKVTKQIADLFKEVVRLKTALGQYGGLLVRAKKHQGAASQGKFSDDYIHLTGGQKDSWIKTLEKMNFPIPWQKIPPATTQAPAAEPAPAAAPVATPGGATRTRPSPRTGTTPAS